jgi:hypothetical protein
MLEVYTCQPNANSGKALFCLHEKGVPFTYRYIDMGKREHFSPEQPRRRHHHDGAGARTLGLRQDKAALPQERRA